MKSKLIAFGFIFAAFGFFSSCTPDPCKDVVCGTFGTCLEGDCLCDDGYELDANGACNTEMRTKFIGTYQLAETCVDDTGAVTTWNYACNITASGVSVDKIIFNNLYDQNVSTTATVSGKSFTIASQAINNSTISGSGTINDGVNPIVISFTYTVTFANGDTDTCTGTMTRQ